jgi:hypothetical protein
MESNPLAGALQPGSGNASGAGSHQLSAQAGRFEALLQQSPAPASPLAAGQPSEKLSSIEFGDRYADEVAPQQSGLRPVTIPNDFVSFGQSISDEMRALQTKFDSSSKKITDPYLLELREEVKAAVQFQDMNARLRAAMKGVELSVQSFSQLFKMQG